MLAAKVSTSTWSVLLLWCASTIIHAQVQRLNVKCMDQCTFTLVESIPENLTYPASAPILLSTYEAHLRILRNAKSSIHLSTFYWTLLGNDTDFHDYSSYEGESIFNSINAIAKAGNVTVMLAQNNSNADTDILSKNGAQVRTVDFERLIGAGVLHTKMHLVDGQHMYLGSANMDWRSYTQTKELGVLVENCPCLGKDAEKLFQVYWYLGKPDAEVPKHWPEQYSTNINMSDPVLVPFNDTKAPVYLASSPPSFCPDGRTSDIDALLEVVRSAKDFIYISVMDYFPAIIYKKPYRFWPVIDDALRRAVIDRDVTLYLMAAHWAHTHGDMYGYLKSLDDMNRVYRGKVVVKLFTVPATPEQKKIPFARVDHCKYMVTDQHAYIGTSNWSGDYFTATGGLSFVIEQPKNETVNENGNIRQQLEDVFLRDFFSEYSKIVN